MLRGSSSSADAEAVAFASFARLLEAGASTSGSSTTLAFQACYGSVLALLACAQLVVATSFLRNRNNALLELSQPVALSLLALTGAVATAGCYLLALPHRDVACALRQPILLTSATLMGSIIAGRAWRIASIVAPAALVGSSEEEKRNYILRMRQKVMVALTTVTMRSCNMKRFTGEGHRMKISPNSIRRQVTFSDFVKVVILMCSPQLVVQVIFVSLSSVRMRSSVVESAGTSFCHSGAGVWPLIVGVVLILPPFLVALLVNVPSHQGMPDCFREYNEIVMSMKLGLGVLVITAPSIGMIPTPTPNVEAYLWAASALSITLPLIWKLAWTKIYNLTWKANTCRVKVVRKSAVARQRSLQRPSFSSPKGAKESGNLETIQMAEDALTMGKMFETMGRSDKALETYRNTLSMFKNDDDFYADEGFTESEIRNFGAKELQIVLSVLITSSKLAGTVQHAEEAGRLCLEALKVVDEAPAKRSLKDRSVIFQVYSFAATVVKGGRMAPPHGQNPAEFEMSLVSKYVCETRHSIYHHCRSLCLRAEVWAKCKEFDKALAVLDEVKSLYDPGMHSTAISNDYGSDHCANTISLSSLWLLYLDRPTDALKTSNDVIACILPAIDGRNNMLGLTLLLMPVVFVLKFHGEEERAQRLFDESIAQAFGNDSKSPAKAIIRPVMMLLTLARIESRTPVADTNGDATPHYADLNADIAWMLEGEEKVTDWSDTIFTNIGWSPYSILADVCLHLALQVSKNKKNCDPNTKAALIGEGLRFFELAEKKMKDIDGNVVLPIPYFLHERVGKELEAIDHESPTNDFV